MEVDLILFDWGGTLAAVERQAHALCCGALAAAEILAARPGEGDSLVGEIQRAEQEAAADPTHREADLRAVVARWASSLGGPVDPDRLAAAQDALGRAWVGSLVPLPGARQALESLRRRAYPIGLVSNCCLPPEYCRQELARQGLPELLDFAVFSSEVGYRKPSPVIYEEALKKADSRRRPADRSRVLFVGDSPALDVMAPAGMGMKTALINRPPGIWPAADYARARPDLRIDTVAELPELLDR